MRSIQITSTIPEKGRYDVIVAGGGVAGVAAALAARRRGKSILLIEKTNLLGGLATIGLVNLFVPMCNGRGKQIIKGMVDEFIALSRKYGWDITPPEWQHGEPATPTDVRYTVRFSANLFALALTEAVVAEGISLLFDSVVSEPVMCGDICRGVVVENKSGREFYEAGIVIDTTGDADILYRAGVPTFQGGNYDTYYAFCSDFKYFDEAKKLGSIYHAYKWCMGGTANLYGKNHPENMPLDCGTTAQNITEYQIRNQLKLLKNLKNRDRNTRDIITLPTMCQFRTTRHIEGSHALSTDDAYRHFDDSIGTICDFDRRDYLFEVPYRTLVHPDFANLITAGRTAAAKDYAWDILRVIPPAIITGQAAGEAAALAVETGAALPAVDIAELQKRLSGGNVMIHFDDALIPQTADSTDPVADIGHI